MGGAGALTATVKEVIPRSKVHLPEEADEAEEQDLNCVITYNQPDTLLHLLEDLRDENVALIVSCSAE